MNALANVPSGVVVVSLVVARMASTGSRRRKVPSGVVVVSLVVAGLLGMAACTSDPGRPPAVLGPTGEAPQRWRGNDAALPLRRAVVAYVQRQGWAFSPDCSRMSEVCFLSFVTERDGTVTVTLTTADRFNPPWPGMLITLGVVDGQWTVLNERTSDWSGPTPAAWPPASP